MSDEFDQPVPFEVRSDGIRISDLARAGIDAVEPERQAPFWASPERESYSDVAEVLEIAMGSPKRVNHLACEISKFPVQIDIEYLDRDLDGERWLPLRIAIEGATVHPALKVAITQSIPAVVNTAISGEEHPQHFGSGHWQAEAWSLIPVVTDRIRFIMRRIPGPGGPKSPLGSNVPYSVAIKNVVPGYRVRSRKDIPRDVRKGEPFASSTDLLGSRVVYSLYEQSAERMLDGSDATAWRCDPQPVNYAVVPLYFDMRDENGQAPLVDRWYVDPLTSGVNCNIYVSDHIPESNFEGSSDPLPTQHYTVLGSPTVQRSRGVRRDVVGLTLASQQPDDIDPQDPAAATAGGPVGYEISNRWLNLSHSDAWWTGIEYLDPLDIDVESGEIYPLLGIGEVSVYRHGKTLRVAGPDGALELLTLDRDVHLPGTRVRLVVSYHPTDTLRLPYLRLALKVGDHPVESVEVASDLGGTSGPIRVGRTPRNLDTGNAIHLRGLVVKEEEMAPESEADFMASGADYVLEPLDGYRDTSRITNALLRAHPYFYDTDGNRTGFVGGPGARYDLAVWTPIARDHVLRQGYMNLPPTKARYWKFEFTGLVPQVYESFLSLDREVLCFPPDVVASHAEVGPQNSASTLATGVATVKGSDRAGEYTYVDALRYLESSAEPDANEVLIISDPDRAEEAAETGWVWQFQPWHSGASAPRFTRVQQHNYEKIWVRHQTKVAFFVGLKELRPYRVDYTFVDDTPEITEHFLDSKHLASTNSVDLMPTGGLQSRAPGGSAESQSINSFRPITGVQYATQETGILLASRDPELAEKSMSDYSVYGDAAVEWRSPGQVAVSRNVAGQITYGELELRTYGEMEQGTYGDLEGAPAPVSADGGLVTRAYPLPGSGNMVGYVDFSAVDTLDGPVLIEIVSSFDDKVGVSTSRRLFGGERARVRVEFPPGSTVERISWGQVEDYVNERARINNETPPNRTTTYADLEGYSYGQLESGVVANSSVYLRIRQQGASNDTIIVHEMALYDVPVVWSFSNDDGATWHQAVGVRNDPNGVLRFPEEGRSLRWRCEIWRRDACVNSLYIRPWYGERHAPEPHTHELQAQGPNLSAWDDYPPIHKHPAWATPAFS